MGAIGLEGGSGYCCKNVSMLERGRLERESPKLSSLFLFFFDSSPSWTLKCKVMNELETDETDDSEFELTFS